MILNSESVEAIRENSSRLAHAIRNKEDLVDLATASSFEQVFAAIETLLTNTNMYFDDEILANLNVNNWQSFKAVLLVYTLNIVNRVSCALKDNNHTSSASRDFGVSSTIM